MRSIEAMQEIMHHQRPGLWVGGVHGLAAETPDQAQYLVERDETGQWGVAVRGHNDGQLLPVDAVMDSGLWYGKGQQRHQVVGLHRVLEEVAPWEAQDYREALTGDEMTDELLVQVLEKRESGVWEVLVPREINVYDTAGRILIDAPTRVAFQPVNFVPDANEGLRPMSFAGFSYDLLDAQAVEVIYDDPVITVSLHETAMPLWVLSSLGDRITPYPVGARHVTSLHEDSFDATDARAQLDRAFSPHQD